MARRAKSTFNPTHLLLSIAAVASVALLGYKLLSSGGGASGGYVGVVDLSVREYLDNSNALSSNTYRMEGTIDERLDNWRSTQGRLFSVLVDDGTDVSPVPVFVPAQFNSSNIQRGQRFRFKVTVQSGTGVLEVVDMTKS
ncbi:MAG: hypothetical protein ACOYMN_21010 [Roseimicrobium sp.]